MRRMKLACFLSIFALSALVCPARAESLDKTIDYLIERVRTADATFVRNGTSHSPAEAVAHIRAKYEHFKGEIRTPEDFIRLAASKSLLTGKPYLVHPAGGKEIPLQDWLLEALKAHRIKDG